MQAEIAKLLSEWDKKTSEQADSFTSFAQMELTTAETALKIEALMQQQLTQKMSEPMSENHTTTPDGRKAVYKGRQKKS